MGGTLDLENERHIITLLPGIYYIKLLKNVSVPFEYTVCFLLFPGRKDTLFSDEEPNNTFEDAKVITNNTFFEGNISFYSLETGICDSVDCYKFNLGDKTNFSIVLDSAKVFSVGNPTYEFFRDGMSKSIATGYIPRTLDNTFRITPGTYYIKIKETTANDYSFKIQLKPDTTSNTKIIISNGKLFYNSMDLFSDTTVEDTFTSKSGNLSYGADRKSASLAASAFSDSWAEGKFCIDSVGTLNQYGISFWLQSGTYSWASVLTIGTNTNAQGAFVFTYGASKEIELFTIGPNSSYTPNSIPADSCLKWKSKWTHFAVTRDTTGKATLIVNGKTRFNLNLDPISSTSKFYLGDYFRKNKAFWGAVDELYILNRPFTEEELQNLAEPIVTGVRQPVFVRIPKTNMKSPVMYDLLGKTVRSQIPVGNGIYINKIEENNRNNKTLFLK
jgi:hypothetical protein